MTARELLDHYGLRSVKALEDFLTKASKAYYTTGRAVMPDVHFDKLLEVLRRKKPSSSVLTAVRAPVSKRKTQVSLPYVMPSLDKKIFGTGTLQKWLDANPGPYTLTDKLDGVSVEVEWAAGEYHLFVGGDAKTGFSADNLIEFLNLPPVPPGSGCARAELIMSKAEFDAKWAGKFKNSRNLVSGIVNKTRGSHEAASSVRAVFYDVLHKRVKHSEALAFLKRYKFETVRAAKATSLTESKVHAYLRKREKDGHHLIDGLVITRDVPFSLTAANPKQAIAFKAPSEGNHAVTQVVDIEWNASRTGRWIPRAVLKPVKLAGVTVTAASAFNAKYVVDNKLGPGSKIEIIRSGEVIPDIQAVLTPSREMTYPPKGKYKRSGVHFIVVGKNDVQDVKAITHFFKEGLGVFGIAEGKVRKLYDAGYDSIDSILRMKERDFLKVEGFQDKTAESLYSNIHMRARMANVGKVVASVVQSALVGERRCAKLIATHPQYADVKKLARTSVTALAAHLRDVGLDASADEAAPMLKEAAQFVAALPLHFVVKKASSTRLSGVVVVFTGVRDKALEEAITDAGGAVGSGVSAKTTYVVTNDVGGSSSKLKKARTLNIPILTLEALRKQLKL